MPRDGSGIYTKPFPDVVEGTTIESTVHNGTVADVETDLNAPRPIVAGGTGATNATDARDSLSAEVAGQGVTNYDSHVWENGSFFSTDSATGGPIGGKSFVGDAYSHSNPDYISISARCINDSVTPGRAYVRQKIAGVWGAWTIDGDDKVSVAGDTMTGDLRIQKAYPNLILDKTTDATSSYISGQKNSLNRWALHLGNDAAESGSQTGSNFLLSSFDDAGNPSRHQMHINRQTGVMTVGPTAEPAPGFVNATTGSAWHHEGTMYLSRGDYPALFVSMNISGFVQSIQCFGTQVGAIQVSPTTTTYLSLSDERLKEDLQSFDAGNIIDDTKVYSFRWKETGERSYGMIAQQVNTIFPDATAYSKDTDRWFMDNSKYVPVILQELQALRKRVAELEVQAGLRPAPPDSKPQ